MNLLQPLKRLNIVVLFILFSSLSIYSQGFKTFKYFQNDTISLSLDIFEPDSLIYEKQPLFIYVHGGGFKNGSRKSGYRFCKYLADKGVLAASISYTLYMKDKSFGCDGIMAEKVKAIQIAVNQLWVATSYLVKAKELNIDSSLIFIGGNSAGAEVAWHAAYWSRKTMRYFNHDLKDDFKYAGLVNSAGAIMDLNLITENNVLPALIAHGDKDKLVPYATAAHHYCKHNAPGWLMLFGSYTIYKHMIELNKHVELFTYKNYGHECHNWIFKQEPQLVIEFINRVINDSTIQNQSFLPTY